MFGCHVKIKSESKVLFHYFTVHENETSVLFIRSQPLITEERNSRLVEFVVMYRVFKRPHFTAGLFKTESSRKHADSSLQHSPTNSLFWSEEKPRKNNNNLPQKMSGLRDDTKGRVDHQTRKFRGFFLCSTMLYNKVLRTTPHAK